MGDRGNIDLMNGEFEAIEKLLLDSLRWSRDHKGQQYRHAISCEWCLQQGLCHAIAILSGGTTGEVRDEYTEMVKREKKTSRKKAIKRPAKKRVVVRKKR